MKRKLLLLLILLCGISAVYAQIEIDFTNLTEEQIYRKGNKYNLWSITAGWGPVIYYTDMTDFSILPKGNWRFGPSINVARQFGRSWAVDVDYMFANMYGKKENTMRYFEGDFHEVTGNVMAYINQLILGGPIKDKWDFYAKLGIGVNLFRSCQKYQDTHDYVQASYYINSSSGYPHGYVDWNPNDYLVMGYDKTTPTKELSRKSVGVIIYGAGVRYRINKSFDLGFEATLRNITGDHLDVDMTGADNDSYMYANFSLTYKIGKKDKRHAAWTYKDFNLDYSRDRAKDPLAQKLDSLAKTLEYLAANDSVVNDTVRINQSKYLRKEIFAASVFFDFDKSAILDMSHRTLSNVARYMKANPEKRILIQGHCDFRGSYEYNVGLSTRRCNAVKDVLVKGYGFDPARIDIDPKGKSELLSDTNNLPKGIHLVNRRVDVFPIIEDEE